MKKTFMVVGIIVAIILMALVIFQSTQKNEKNTKHDTTNQESTTIIGECIGTKGGCMINNIYIPYDQLNSITNPNGKILEIKGVLTEYPCPEELNVQCFNGQMIKTIESIKEIKK